MKRMKLGLNEIRAHIEKLKGQAVDMRVDCGRKRIVFRSGIIQSVYPSVFTVKMFNQDIETVSFSYSDVLCGDLVIERKEL